MSGTAETRPYNPREIYTKSELADMASKINSLPPNMPLPPNMTQAQAQALLAQLQSTGKLPANMGGAVDGQKAAGGDAPAESDDMPDLEVSGGSSLSAHLTGLLLPPIYAHFPPPPSHTPPPHRPLLHRA